MKNYLNSRLLRHILISTISIASVTAYSSISAQVVNVFPKTVSYGSNYAEITNQGQSRNYYIYTPKSYNRNRPMPLVLVFHGDGGSGQAMSDVSRFNALAEQKGFIVVYPNGINHTWSNSPDSDDVSFVKALIERVQQIRNIDQREIYATGFSSGGILTQTLACELPDKIAAFASVAGSMPVQLQPSCQPHTPVSILTINGTNDQEVHYQGDDNSQPNALVSIPNMVKFWRSHDHTTSPNQENINSTKVKISHYYGDSGSEVMEADVVNGGHFWPGGTSTDTNVNEFNSELGLNASQTIWNFFEHHKLS